MTDLLCAVAVAVMEAGDEADEIFFVYAGIVEISATNPTEDIDHKVSAIVEKGDCFGDEVIFARDSRRKKFARCRTDSEVLKLKKDDLHEVLQASGDARKLEKSVEKQSASQLTRTC